MDRIFMIGRPKGLPRRQCPRLTGLREEVADGNYALILEFQNRNKMNEEQWAEREAKFGTFFGPGITANVRFLYCCGNTSCSRPACVPLVACG